MPDDQEQQRVEGTPPQAPAPETVSVGGVGPDAVSAEPAPEAGGREHRGGRGGGRGGRVGRDGPAMS